MTGQISFELSNNTELFLGVEVSLLHQQLHQLFAFFTVFRALTLIHVEPPWVYNFWKQIINVQILSNQYRFSSRQKSLICTRHLQRPLYHANTLKWAQIFAVRILAGMCKSWIGSWIAIKQYGKSCPTFSLESVHYTSWTCCNSYSSTVSMPAVHSSSFSDLWLSHVYAFCTAPQESTNYQPKYLYLKLSTT